jgi:hypothetical protein
VIVGILVVEVTENEEEEAAAILVVGFCVVFHFARLS